jgi:hypothetical protein
VSALFRWTPAVGDEVAVIESHSFWTTKVKTTSTIDRIGKRDIVLANGQRFNINSRQQVGGDTFGNSELVSINDPQLADIAAEDRLRELKTALSEAWGRFSGQPGPAAAVEVSEAALAYAAQSRVVAGDLAAASDPAVVGYILARTDHYEPNVIVPDWDGEVHRTRESADAQVAEADERPDVSDQYTVYELRPVQESA